MPQTMEQLAWNHGIPNFQAKEVNPMEDIRRFTKEHSWVNILDEKSAAGLGRRWAKAVELYEEGSVHWRSIGLYLVNSQTDPRTEYTVCPESGCTCPDFRDRAPFGWCKHRLATWIANKEFQDLRDQAIAQREERAPLLS